MQKAAMLVAVLAVAALSGAAAVDTNPLSKTIELLESLSAKVAKEGEVEMKAYKEYIEWCDDYTKEKGFELKTLYAEKEKLEAAIAKATACIEESGTTIEELAASIATAQASLQNATLIRDKEKADFLAAEAELLDTVDTLERAIAIIQREMAKNPALMQVDTTSLQHLIQSMSAVIEAAALKGSDQKKLMGLVQAKAGSSDSDESSEDLAALGAPDPAAYKSHS